MKKILIINPFGIGDVIFSTPLIWALRKNYPNSSICYICNKRAYDIIKSNPCLNKLFIYEKDDYRALWAKSRIKCIKKVLDFLKMVKTEKFDIVIDLSLAYQYSFLLKLIGVKKRLGFNYRNRGKFLTDKLTINGFDDKHVIEYYLDLLKLLGIDSSEYSNIPRVYLAEKDTVWAGAFLKDNSVNQTDLLIGIIPGCGASWGKDAVCRRWSKNNFARVADDVIDKYGAKVLLFGDSKEVEICADVQKSMRHKAIMCCGKTSLGGFLGLLNKCELVITNDGGPLHMAIGVGARTISIFGPVDERIYGPYPQSDKHVVISRNDISCRPCYKKFKYNLCEDRVCLNNISVDEVLSAVGDVLAINRK